MRLEGIEGVTIGSQVVRPKMKVTMCSNGVSFHFHHIFPPQLEVTQIAFPVTSKTKQKSPEVNNASRWIHLPQMENVLHLSMVSGRKQMGQSYL